jgi:hypothetical protein
MQETTATWRIGKKLVPATGGMMIVFLWAIVTLGQTTPTRGKTQSAYPRLPGAVTKAPAWIGSDAPFDVAKYFEAVPRERNAAPLYLDALFEFSGELEVCFPEGPGRSRRSQTANDRSKRYADLTQAAYSNTNSALDPAAVDEIVKLHETGYRKLAEAQRLPLCVFETGLSPTAMFPHAQASRQVARVSSLKLQRAIQRGDLAAAIREIELVLRLARDLRPRGATITQLVAVADSQFVFSGMLPAILASPRLRAEHCERLIKVLSAHETKSVDGYAEGLHTEYLLSRVALRELIHNQGELSKAMGLKPGESVVFAMVSQSGPRGSTSDPDAAAKTQGAGWDALVARTSPAVESQRAGEINRFFTALLELDGLPYARRIENVLRIKPPTGTDPLSLVFRMLMDPARMEAVARAESRASASLRAAQCMLALRQWQLSNRGVPSSLASVVKGAGLKSVPIDPYDGKLFKLAVVDGAPLVYSVGRDGQDDGGLVDSDRDQKPAGDLLYRLPAIEQKRVLKP